ncbi:MAG: calcium-translocating P-type ATPase, SERCA-type [Deltaproteobacteria bacterium]
MKPWQLDKTGIVKELGTDPARGLSSEEARRRLAQYGPNVLEEKEKINPLRIFFEQFNDLIIWILAGAALVSGFLREWVDALAIVAIIILNAVLGFIQEYRAEKSLAALRKLSTPSSKVYRDGELEIVPSAGLVPGDLIELEAGDNIPADSRLVWLTANFLTHEASLTGESTPVEKTELALEETDVPLADRANMVYMGTSVSGGKARAVVVNTGMGTELGRIAGLIQEIKLEATPLQKRLEDFGRWIVYICFVLVALVFVLGVMRGGSPLDMFLTSVSLAVAAIPEGLPAVVTIALAMGVQRMVRRNALIRKLPSVETLGSTTVICSDKTGTLTRNEMTVRAVFAEGEVFTVTGSGYSPEGEFRLGTFAVNPANHPDLRRCLMTGVLCNSAQLEEQNGVYRIVGDPTEGALLAAGAKGGVYKKESEWEYRFVEEIPFDSVRKKMTVVRSNPEGGFIVFVKGAPDSLLPDCSHIEDKGTVRELTQADRERILKMNDAFASQALRVLAFSYRKMQSVQPDAEASAIERDLVFSGLMAMIDPPREEAKKAIVECTTAGIRTVMITGDHKKTAVAVARELGLAGEGDLAVTGEELDRMSDEEFTAAINRIRVYARVSPEHKLRIVRGWKAQGQIVAMTGDGVNDAPAVKEADIGVSMGIAGTDVTKEVSDMVVLDDNFASIVHAVEEGRGIYDNIKKFIHYLLSCNTGEILVMFVASLVGMPVPLLPVHILWVNLVTDGLPALALGVDPVAKDVMTRPPRPLNEGVVTYDRMLLMLLQGSFIAFCSLLAFYYVLYVEYEGITRARTACFVVLSCSQLFHALNCRSQEQSLFTIGFFTNKKLILADSVSFLLAMAVVYVPFFQIVFKTEPLGLSDWVMVVGISSLPLWVMELVKRARARHAAARA